MSPVLPAPQPSSGSPWRLLAAFLAAAALLAVLHGVHWREFAANKEYTYDGVPLLTTADGYYFLRLTTEHANRDYDPVDRFRAGNPFRPAPPPLLAEVTLLAHRLTRINIDEMAFFLPPVLAVLASAAYVLWGQALGGAASGFLAALAGGAGVAFFFRATLGRFDTDCLQAFFFLLIGLGLYRFVVVRTPARWAYLALACVGTALLAWWWEQLGKFSPLPFLVAYALSFPAASGRVERRLKYALLALGAAGAGLVLLDGSALLPKPLAAVIHEAASALSFVTKGEEAFFPAVGLSIDELMALPLDQLSYQVAGHGLPLAAGLLGAALLAWRRPLAALFALGPCAVLGLLSLVAQRFVVFLIPVYALGLAWLCLGALEAVPALFRRLGPWVAPGLARTMLGLTLGSWLLAPSVLACLERPLRPVFMAQDVDLAIRLQSGQQPSGVVWSMWDSGYFHQYWSHQKSFIDGGNQIPLRNYLAAAPLADPDPVFARHWIRFFAVQDLGGFNTLARRLGGPAKTLAFLNALFRQADRADDILRQYGFGDVTRWRQYLFPDGKVYLALTPTALLKPWWFHYGRWQPGQTPGAPQSAQVADKATTVFDPQDMRLFYEQSRMPLGGAVEVSAARYARLWPGNNREGHVLVDMASMDSYLLLPPAMYDTLTCRLLFQAPDTTAGFKVVNYHPLIGGTWAVQ